MEVTPEHTGRTAQRLRATLSVAGTPVATARGLRLRRVPVPVPPPGDDPWPAPDHGTPLELSFFRHPVGYHTAVEARVVRGAWGRTPICVWARPLVPLVAGQPTTPLERLVTLADAQSGLGVPLDPLAYRFLNPDLTVHLERPPAGEWFGFDIRSTAAEHGAGLAQSAVRDERGWVARTAQTLVVRPTAPRG